MLNRGEKHNKRAHQGERALVVVAEDKDGDAGAEGDQPLDKHPRKALRVLLAQRIEEVAAQEIEQHTASARN